MFRNNRAVIGTVVLLVCMANPLSAAELTEKAIKDYYSAWSDANLDNVLSFFADGAIYEDVATGDLSTGKEQIRAFAKKFLEGTPGVKVVPTSVLIGNGSAAVEWTMSAGTGQEAWSVRGAAIIQHHEGYITRATDYWNAE